MNGGPAPQLSTWIVSYPSAHCSREGVYDGANVVGEYDGAGALVAKYAQGSGIDEPLAMWRGGQVGYYNADGLGSVTSVIDSTLTPLATYSYDAFGKRLTTGGSLTNPFQYTGREWDQETGLYYYRARYYEPNTGRFLSGDPVGFWGTDVNFYRYVRNHPAGFVDSSGLLATDPNFRPDCLQALSGALNILRRLPKKCNCAFLNTGSRRSLQELIDDPKIVVHSEEHDALVDGNIEGGYTLPGNTHEIWLRPFSCRMGRWKLAQVLIHELTHITLTPGSGQEDQAYAMELQCDLFPLSQTVNVQQNAPLSVPTITMPLPGRIPE